MKPRIYANTQSNHDRTAAPADEVAAFMAKNLFYCQLLAARISAKQCEVNRSNDLYSCGKCDQALLAAPVPKKRNNYGRTHIRPAKVPTEKPAAPATPRRTQVHARVALAEQEAVKDPAPPEEVSAPKATKPAKHLARRRTCPSCKREDVQIVGKGLCGRCYHQSRKTTASAAPAPAEGQVRSGQVRSGQVRGAGH